MNRLMLLLFVVPAFIISCGQKTSEIAEQAGQDSTIVSKTADEEQVTDTAVSVVAEETVQSEAPSADASSPYAAVTRWEVTLYSISVYGDDVTEVEYKPTIITDKAIVKRLNEMMSDRDKYDDYISEVKISGNTARARWYDGNRGGGICDDFPQDIVEALTKDIND